MLGILKFTTIKQRLGFCILLVVVPGAGKGTVTRGRDIRWGYKRSNLKLLLVVLQ